MKYLAEQKLIMVEMSTNNSKRWQRKEEGKQKTSLRDGQYFVKI